MQKGLHSCEKQMLMAWGLLSRLLSFAPKANKRPLTCTDESRLNSGFLWEPAVGFEPTACCLRNSCSAPELRWRFPAYILSSFRPIPNRTCALITQV